MEYGETAKLFKALGDENRLYILSMLQHGERCACVLLEHVNLSQPTLSHHMKILCETHLVTSRKEGKWVYYSLNRNKAGQAEQALADLFQEKEPISDAGRCQMEYPPETN
ncbi:ArsR/SmtB family transcription factor [Megasphaera sp. UBA4233]|uniref:ArsR/SmtB family transcription factor n=1 Tax=Megasphaera sp. UBA4233 TaxID=1946847 RepID=UPI000ECEA981|nr:metalloregulator ArsR/SmtB family transcription factor [Megasphaera sp. UBA4233]HAM05418.1 transcriptional regulator [Megasphaera sp.]